MTRSGKASPSFFTAAFVADGSLEGTGEWPLSRLSRKWLQACQELLAEWGEVFKASFEGPLADIEMQLTASEGSALLTMRVREAIATSGLLLSGRSAEGDREVAEMFLQSLRSTEMVRRQARGGQPFAEVLSLAQRPLFACVFWGNPEISDDDYSLVGELQNHLAGAFFLSNAFAE